MTEDDITSIERALQLTARAIAGLGGEVQPVRPSRWRLEIE